MAVDQDRLLWPVGRLDPALLWPGVPETEYSEWLEGWTAAGKVQALADGFEDTDAESRVVLDQATTLLVYLKAYGGAYEDLLLNPSSVDDPERGSSSRTQGQIDGVGALAEAVAAEYADLLADWLTDPETPVGPVTERTRSVELDIRF
jgi:hypothetical protein